MKKGGKILIVILAAILSLFIIRIANPSEIDDVSPGIPCPEMDIYNPDILYVIPDYNNFQISQNRQWCNYILSLNKTIEMHGITHEYREFLYQNITKQELNSAINEFEICFNQIPDKFKPPQLKISPKNKELIKNSNLKLQTPFSQITHKVYHCNNTGIIDNKWINLF